MIDRRGQSWLTASQNNASCVEVQFADAEVRVRDSKDPDGVVIIFTDAQFSQFLIETIHGLTSANGVVEVSQREQLVSYAGREVPELTEWHVRSVETGVALHYRADEWDAFRTGARDGVFRRGAAAAVTAS
jgi:hypothetical protein